MTPDDVRSALYDLRAFAQAASDDARDCDHHAYDDTMAIAACDLLRTYIDAVGDATLAACGFVGTPAIDTRPTRVVREERRAIILTLAAQGVTQRDIGRRVGLSAAQVNRTLRAAR